MIAEFKSYFNEIGSSFDQKRPISLHGFKMVITCKIQKEPTALATGVI